jgi:hypothetical protein
MPVKKMASTGLTADQWLAGLERIFGDLRVKHEHVVRHEPIPMPVRAEVVIKRMDGSDAWRGHINAGRGMLTMLDVPLANIHPKFSPADFARLEFRWER